MAGQASDASNKTIVSSLENIIYNIAQCDYTSWNMSSGVGGNSPLHQQLIDRITSGDERYVVSGLRALRSIVQAFEFEINADRKPLN